MDNELGIEFLTAVDLIAKKRVSELAFDKTISPCQILKRDDIDESKYFTVSYIDKNLYKKFNSYGSKSGKDINKEEVSGTHIQFLDDGGITFEEAVEVFVCKIIAKSHVQESEVHQDIIEMYKKTPKVYQQPIFAPLSLKC